jgi:hypothetical protein
MKTVHRLVLFRNIQENGRDAVACGAQNVVIPSALFLARLLLSQSGKQIPRFARNDKFESGFLAFLGMTD